MSVFDDGKVVNEKFVVKLTTITITIRIILFVLQL